MARVSILDCTLRDGGHVIQGKFGKNVIKAILLDLVKSKVDIIEAGFLWDTVTDDDTARYHTISELKKYLPEDLGQSIISLMADNVDLSHLEPCDGTVEIIRLSFRKTEFDWAEKTASILKQKGYKVYINPIHGSSFSDEEYIKIIERVNRIKPYGFSIVDTFGAMRQSDLARIYYLVEHNLDKDIVLGLHLHENLGLAYSLAQYALSIVAPTRNITIDGALYGMGKIPGNLCVEQLMDYLNISYNTNYYTEPVYDSIDDYIMPIYEKNRWGYSVPYALSAQCGVHRTYAEYLMNKERLHTKEIRRLLRTIDEEHSEIFNKEYIENIYRNYMLADYSNGNLNDMIKIFSKVKQFVVIAPGPSISRYSFEPSLLENSCVITVNFVLDEVKANYYFFTNTKRMSYAGQIDNNKMIITSNLVEDVKDPAFIISRNELAYHEDMYSDDSTLMLLNLLKVCRAEKIYVAGFDGFLKHESNFYDNGLERTVRADDYDQTTRINVLRKAYAKMNIQFLTPSAYEEAFK